MKILIIEKEKEISDNIATFLSSDYYLCEQAFTYADAKMKINLYEYECIILDFMLPDGNGLDLLKEMRNTHNQAGVIIVSTKDSVNDRIKGLEVDADDYMSKPFSLPELKMRIYAIIRRIKFNTSNILYSNGITIDLLRKTVSVNSEIITLTKTEYELLLFLISNKNKVISKLSMAEHLTGEMADMLNNHNFVYTHIKNLKAKLTQKGCSTCIKNVYGTGYKWIEE